MGANKSQLRKQSEETEWDVGLYPLAKEKYSGSLNFLQLRRNQKTTISKQAEEKEFGKLLYQNSMEKEFGKGQV